MRGNKRDRGNKRKKNKRTHSKTFEMKIAQIEKYDHTRAERRKQMWKKDEQNENLTKPKNQNEQNKERKRMRKK